MDFNPGNQPATGAHFRTTHWTLVLQAARPGSPTGDDAFAQLYLDYWRPLYSYVRRRGYAPAEAEDITQDFFTCLIEKERLAHLERQGGRFRSFLLTALDHFLANRWHRAHAQKRGGGVEPLSLHADEGELEYALCAAETDTPETLFERQWVSTLLNHVLDRLQQECEAAGKRHLFGDLKSRLQGDNQELPYAEVAARHGLTEGAVKVAVHRLRQRYGEMLREEVSRTVADPAEIEEELRYLVAVASR